MTQNVCFKIYIHNYKIINNTFFKYIYYLIMDKWYINLINDTLNDTLIINYNNMHTL